MKTLAKLLPVLALVLGATTLHADSDPPAPPPPPAPTAPAAPAASGSATVGASATVNVAPPVISANLSITDMESKSAALLNQIADDSRHVLYLKEQAKKAKDVIKLSCVNDKMVQLKAQQNIADQANEQLQVALTKNAVERQSLFSQLSQTADAIKRLREEAAACIGEPELYKQESGGSSSHPLFPDDPGNDHPFGGEIEPPAYCSPYD